MNAHNKDNRPIGQTENGTFQIGTRRTFPIDIDTTWLLLVSEPGLVVWLGEVPESGWRVVKGVSYATKDGTRGEIRVVNERVNIRLSWQPRNWSHASTVQVRVIPAAHSGTTVSFHQEGLVNVREREVMRRHWLEVLEKLEGLIVE